MNQFFIQENFRILTRVLYIEYLDNEDKKEVVTFSTDVKPRDFSEGKIIKTKQEYLKNLGASRTPQHHAR